VTEQSTELAETKNQPKWKVALIGAQERFVAIADHDKMVDWKRESMFAMQALTKNSFLQKVASENPGSLRDAIINVAACGITLMPAAQYAALVPRDGAVCLDIMYRGLIKIATDAGSIRWVQAAEVYASDNFVFRGLTQEPIHEAQPFSKTRGEIVGVYCVAKTVDGDILTEIMSVEDVIKIRDRSQYYAKQKKGPWVTDFGEMAKKTVIKRARKTWPESKSEAHNERLQRAVVLANRADGYTDDFNADNAPSANLTPTGDAWDYMDEESQAFLEGIAEKCKGWIAADQVDDAVGYIDSQNLNVDEQVALNTRFDSKQRSAMKKHRAALASGK
jgi:recombination protein RecT